MSAKRNVAQSSSARGGGSGPGEEAGRVVRRYAARMLASVRAGMALRFGRDLESPGFLGEI
jgi:hypothetical protein